MRHTLFESEVKMRSNLVVKYELMRWTMRATGLTTKRALVQAGLQLLLQVKAQTGSRLRGEVQWKGNLNKCVPDEYRRWENDHRRYDGLGDYLKETNKPHVDWIDAEMDCQRLGLTDLILCEIFQGVHGKRCFPEVRRELLNYEIFASGGTELAIAFAQYNRTLRVQRYTVCSAIDCLVASLCLINGRTLLHSDCGFDSVERASGLQVVHPCRCRAAFSFVLVLVQGPLVLRMIELVVAGIGGALSGCASV